jgi:hypothetical protein
MKTFLKALTCVVCVLGVAACSNDSGTEPTPITPDGSTADAQADAVADGEAGNTAGDTGSPDAAGDAATEASEPDATLGDADAATADGETQLDAAPQADASDSATDATQADASDSATDAPLDAATE